MICIYIYTRTCVQKFIQTDMHTGVFQVECCHMYSYKQSHAAVTPCPGGTTFLNLSFLSYASCVLFLMSQAPPNEGLYRTFSSARYRGLVVGA